ncbi:hypothetical protein PHAVU_007G023800 [Phaseolus vulgaris]|uniref:Inner centromere protein ARK-binding domain-containing protein n=1 Tax=Phaseolus vulgaris TaxID=3885 RepID=V7BAM0_PHAVU|nr:hypothetical protein PHAVU_007G023800g [Phaseolus vulgaris]XP_007142871.1 hypothetical protein PHAVU_007G023800g [Phaseolus vulgaris]ESW14864.1 hypothetical protein PHAVU_007G023800g [Phaseolus vulgaris]ESW14865.1 hypothetical protein PHAVU_007G023800g [Phaseolus vulgaris]
MEKHVVQIFERKKRIIEQSRQQCHLWEHHLYPKLLLNGIPPPPWLCNSSLHADPQELNKDDLVSEVVLSQPQYRVPFLGAFSDLDSVSYGVQYRIGLSNEGHALEKEAGGGAHNLPDCSVNSAACGSSGPPEFDTGAVSPPRNQIEERALEIHEDLARSLSLAKVQRSRSRQKALELRNSAKAPTLLSENDDDDAGFCAGTSSGAVPLTQREEHEIESDVVKEFHSDIPSCSVKEMEPRDCVSNFSGLKSRSSSQKKFNSLNVTTSYSVAKEDGPPLDNLNESLEIVNQPCFENGSIGVNETEKWEYQIKEDGKSLYDETLTKSKSSSQTRCNSVLLKLDSSLGSGKGVEIYDLMQPFTHADPTDVSKITGCSNGSGGNAVKDGNSCLNKQESNVHSMIKLLRSSCPSPGHDLLMTGGSVKSIDKSAPSPQPLILQDPVVSVVGSFSHQNNPDFSVVKRGCSSRSGSGKVEEVLKSSRSNICEQSDACSQFSGKKYCNVQLTEVEARRLSSSPQYSKLDIENDRNFSEENVAALSASGKMRALATCSNEGRLRPVSFSNLDGGSLLAESVYIETVVDEKVLDAQENVPSDAIPDDNVQHRSAAIVGEVDEDFDGLVEEDPSCVSPRVGLNLSMSKQPPDFIMSVNPKQLNFDDVEQTRMSGICRPDLEEGQQGVSPEEEPLNSLEPLNLLEKEISPVCEINRNSSGEMPLMKMQEVLIRKEGSHMEYRASHSEEEDIARTTICAVSPDKEIRMVQNEFCVVTSSLLNQSSPSLVAGENSSRSLSKEVMPLKFVSVNSKVKNDESGAKLADSSSEAVTGNDQQNSTDENVTNFTVGFPFSVPLDDVNVSLAQPTPNSITLCQDGDLLRQTLLSDGKITSFSDGFQIFRSSNYDVGHSCPQHKRRKIETEKYLPASSNLLEKSRDYIDERPASRSLIIKDDNLEAAQEVQQLPSDQEEDIEHRYMSNSPTNEMQYNGECQPTKETPLKESKEEKLIVDGGDRSEDSLLLAVANPSGFGIDSTMKCKTDEKVASLQHQVNCGRESVERLSCSEKGTSSRRIYPEGNAKLSDCMSASPGMQCLDLVGTDEALPEFEGFIIETASAQTCITGDEMDLETMDLETMDLSSNSIDNTSLGKSRFMHSPLCSSITPYKLHNIPELYQSLPNGLLEGLGISSSLPLSDASPRSLSDFQPNYKGQCTSSVQTLWDRINSNFGSSEKRKSLKLDLPCIIEVNENVDEIAGTFQRGIDSEGMTGANKRKPLAEIVDDANHSTSVLQDDVLAGGCDDVVSSKFNLSGTCSKVKNKLENSNRKRFTRKGKENQNISLGANEVKRTTESVRKRPGRPKLSGKDSMKRCPINNIVSNVSSFIPLVQQKQAAAVVTGKRDIKVKALEAAEAAKRMAEKKENERKIKKEVLRLQREKVELELQKRKKDEERRKREEQMATKKRQREDEEKEKEKKRKRVNDMKKQLQEHEKIRGKKEEIEIERRTTGEEVQENKTSLEAKENQKNLRAQDKRECNLVKISENESLAMRDSANYKSQEPRLENSESVNDFANNGKVMDNLIKAREDGDLIIENTLQEQSYEISPYKGSDDEDEDEDDMPNNKFIPSWASKHSLSLIVTSQKMDPEMIFPQQSFCNIAEVLLPRKLQLQ